MSADRRLVQAQKYAFRLLKVRPRSEKELRFRLKQKKIDPQTLNSAISFLKETNYINDVDFADVWVRQRINKPVGLKRLELELKQKGVDKEIIDSTLKRTKESYSERDIVLELVKRKFKRILGKEDIDYKEKKKIQGFLLRRGFSNDAIMDVIDKL